MVIDPSALIAILSDEPERAEFVAAIEADASRYLSAASHLECSIVLECRFGPEGVRAFERFADRAALAIMPVDEAQARLAFDAYCRFGKGRHPARLNYGDCFAYALACSLVQPLLYKGDDFARTDVLRVFS